MGSVTYSTGDIRYALTKLNVLTAGKKKKYFLKKKKQEPEFEMLLGVFNFFTIDDGWFG